MTSLKYFGDIIPTQKLDFWIKHNLNVCLEGKHGVGKTSIINAAFKKHKIEYLYFSGSTLDPWVDVVGVPKEVTEDGVTFLDLIRPRAFAFDTVEAIFIDEYNRSHKKVRNAVMELIQFKSINGKKFKNLKFVWVAINPEDDQDNNYQVEPLDPAQIDRFHVRYKLPYVLSKEYLASKYKEKTVDNVISWWDSLDEKIKNTFSPRRVDYALRAVKEGGDVQDFLPTSIPKSVFLNAIKVGIKKKDTSKPDITGITSKNKLLNSTSAQVIIKFKRTNTLFKSQYKGMSNEEKVAFFFKFGVSPTKRLTAFGKQYLNKKFISESEAVSILSALILQKNTVYEKIIDELKDKFHDFWPDIMQSVNKNVVSGKLSKKMNRIDEVSSDSDGLKGLKEVSKDDEESDGSDGLEEVSEELEIYEKINSWKRKDIKEKVKYKTNAKKYP